MFSTAFCLEAHSVSLLIGYFSELYFEEITGIHTTATFGCFETASIFQTLVNAEA